MSVWSLSDWASCLCFPHAGIPCVSVHSQLFLCSELLFVGLQGRISSAHDEYGKLSVSCDITVVLLPLVYEHAEFLIGFSYFWVFPCGRKGDVLCDFCGASLLYIYLFNVCVCVCATVCIQIKGHLQVSVFSFYHQSVRDWTLGLVGSKGPYLQSHCTSPEFS